MDTPCKDGIEERGQAPFAGFGCSLKGMAFDINRHQNSTKTMSPASHTSVVVVKWQPSLHISLTVLAPLLQKRLARDTHRRSRNSVFSTAFLLSLAERRGGGHEATLPSLHPTPSQEKDLSSDGGYSEQ